MSLSIRAALRIVGDVAVYRLRRLEMANLGGAVTIGLVLGLAPGDLALRVAVAVVLNLLVYLNNDYYDVGQDLTATGRDRARTEFLAAHRAEALLAQGALAVVMLGLAAIAGGGLWLVAATGAGICAAYSARLKRVPFLDVLAMIAWGGVMPLVGAPADRLVGWLMAGQLALFSGVFESMQVRRDWAEDRDAGVRTTAVVLGPRRTAWLTRGLVAVAALYAAAVLHPIAAGLAAVALALPVTDDAAKDWTRMKVLLGVTWLVICGLVVANGGTAGLWLHVSLGAGG